jgi:MoaA/NifB/PqqE/SkfB family radical SAM enzyme
VVLQRPEPLIYGVAVTDRRNLACRSYHVSNTGRTDMTWDQIVTAMEVAWSGGEPMLWRDAERTLKDAVDKAKRIGFFHVHVYTNGLLGIETSADIVWVSIDGLPGTFNMQRGNHFHQVEHTVRTSLHPKIALIYVIDRYTEEGIEPFLHWVDETKFPIIGVMCYFHTPYYGRDELFLIHERRAPIVDQLLDCIRAGLPILNPRTGLLVLKSSVWPRCLPIGYVTDIDGESVFCRASDAVCTDNGYAICIEVTEFQRLRLSVLLGITRYW